MTRSRKDQSCLAVLTLVLAAGCGGNSDNGPTPTVSSTTPANAATGVALNGSFTATFSEAMQASSITAATFTLTATGAAAVAGTVTYAGTTGVFKPASNLAANTAYTATIGVGAKSAAGKALAASYSWHATTGSADTTRPTVSSTVPANAATGVSLDGNLAVTFSKPIDPASIVITLKSGTAAVVGAVSASGVTGNFKPSLPLAANASYTATVTAAKDLSGNALASNYSWSFVTGTTTDTDAPAVSSTVPADGASSVATNTAISVSFGEPMGPTTITAASFTLTSPGAVAVAGTVTYAGVTATFQPAGLLANNTIYTATISTAAQDLAGNALAAGHSWSFTTGAAADTTPPTVASTSPLPGAIGVGATAGITATFSKAMAPLTISSSTFTLTGPGNAAVSGTVVFDAPNKVATFQPSTSLAANTSYQATVEGGASGVTDLAGNALASNDVWGFTTGAHATLAPVLLGSAVNYVILAKSAVSTVPTSAVTGDVGLSPAAESYLTGFALTDATGYATSTQVVGKLYAADQTPPTPSIMTTAVSDMQTAYTDAAGRPTPDFLELGTGAIGGLDLAPGLYKWTSTVTIASDVTLTGSATDVWIMQISGDLTMSSAKHVFLAGGALAKNVFWQVAGTVDLGTTAHFEGIILSQTAITLETGASMNGRALAQTAVSLDAATVTQPAP